MEKEYRSNRFIFVGNRRFVLDEMIKSKCTIVWIFVIAGSHLENDINNGYLKGWTNIDIIEDKKSLVEKIKNYSGTYDVLISNGCKYLLPIGNLPQAVYVNIHPSYLPNLRGVDPVIGAILHSQDSGATCHLIDNGVDTGDIISQIKIPFSDDLDVQLLYQLSFVAEKMVFNDSLRKKFIPLKKQQDSPDNINYKRREEDKTLWIDDELAVMLKKVKAFNNSSLGCIFHTNQGQFRVFEAKVMRNSFLTSYVSQFQTGVVAMAFEDSIIFRKGKDVIRFTNIISAGGVTIEVNDVIM
jgi:methionyl-tRNA formyltransferase